MLREQGMFLEISRGIIYNTYIYTKRSSEEYMPCHCHRNGFTLIELLAVVLIIAVLAAIALPQYRKAVEKSRGAQGLAAAKALGESVARFRLTHGAFPTTFDELDVRYEIRDLINGTSAVYGRINNDFRVDLIREPAHAGTILLGRMVEGLRYVIAYCPDGSIWCSAFADGATTDPPSNSANERAYCQSIGGVLGALPAGCTTYRQFNYRLR